MKLNHFVSPLQEGISLKENSETNLKVNLVNRYNSTNWAKPNSHSIRKNWAILLSCVIALFVFTTCGNDDDDVNGGNGTVDDNIFTQNPPKSGDVYVVGYDGREATVWKNGEWLGYATGTDISDTYKANSIYISGKDTYIAGTSGYGGGILWKNGVPDGKNFGGNARSVFVEGSDVYVAGGSSVWKNGVEQSIINGGNTGAVNSVYVFRGNVYVAGYSSNVYEYQQEWASIWLNGAEQKLPSVTWPTSRANFVFVSDNGDVYVTGNSTWKNGNVLYNTGGNSIYVSNDVYVAGVNYSKNAILWKNGVAQQLSSLESSANSVFVVGNDVYVAGYEYFAPNRNRAVLWKNGVAQYLSDGAVDAAALSVFVVK